MSKRQANPKVRLRIQLLMEANMKVFSIKDHGMKFYSGAGSSHLFLRIGAVISYPVVRLRSKKKYFS